MQLLVSVRHAREAAAALAGGADIVDAKNPETGALGAVTLEDLRAIVAAVSHARPVTAALGDAIGAGAVERRAAAFAAAGATLVKVGFAGAPARSDVAAIIGAAARGAGAQRVIAVAYADYARVLGPSPEVVAAAACDAGVAGVLLDTADKDGDGLPALVAAPALHAWVASLRARGMLAALAGKLRASDLEWIQSTGADIAGMRGAACEGGRTGRVTADRVRAIRMCLTTPLMAGDGNLPGRAPAPEAP